MESMMVLESFLSAAAIVFLAELGDKTMLATVCLSAQYRRPLFVLIAAMLALTVSTIIAVVIGVILSTTLPLDLIILLSGGIFIILGIFALIRKESDEETCTNQPQTFLSIFSLVLVSEMGDKTQIASLALAAQSAFPFMVFLGALLGFLLVNGIGAIAGEQISKRVPIRLIQNVTGLVFIVAGILIVVGII
jgi:putative Ca2+/H+ antiporter (TMEM165/GDT1 family)